jgi:hypothetical protein
VAFVVNDLNGAKGADFAASNERHGLTVVHGGIADVHGIDPNGPLPLAPEEVL